MEMAQIQEKSLKVLVVEDNPGDVYVFTRHLKLSSIDFEIINCSTLKDAINISLRNNFDIILLDLGLPDSIGLNTLKKIINAGVKAPIIVMTGLDDENIALQAVKEGAQDYLVKNDITSEAFIRSIRYSIERKNIQEALQLLNEELDMKVQERTAELTEVNSLLQAELTEHQKTMEKLKESAVHLKELNALKDKFFSIIAHDLRNPFSTLLGSAELLMNYIDNMNPSDIRKISQTLYNSAKSGFSLLENLLEWSRSQTGNISFRPEVLNLKKLIENNIAEINIYLENKNIEVTSEINDNIEIPADRNMINAILRNLLNNAVKFSHKNGKVIVTAITSKDNIIISVKDNGIGMSATNVARLFHFDSHFSSQGTAQEKGTGLGLLLCKEFIDKHNGKIWVDSVEGNGSEFKFSIPLRINSKNQTMNANKKISSSTR